MKKKIFTAVLCCTIAWSGVFAQSSGHLSLGLELFSTTGFGLELATPLSPNIALRGGISMFPLSLSETFNTSLNDNIRDKIDAAVNNSDELRTALVQQGLPTRAQDINTDIEATASLGLVNGKILVDFYPSARKSFHVTGGFYIGAANLVKVEGKMDEAVEILTVLKSHGFDYFGESFAVGSGNNPLSGHDLLDINGALKINSVKPYLGIGFGRAVPVKRVGVNFEIGAFYQGAPKITSDNPNIQKLIDDELDDVIGVLNKWSIYPVLSLKLNFRLF